MTLFVVLLVLTGAIAATVGHCAVAPEGLAHGIPFPPGTNASGEVRNMVLTYIDGRSLPPHSDPAFVFDAQKFESLSGFTMAPHGGAGSITLDTLFDAVLLIGYDWLDGKRFWPGTGTAPLNGTDWATIASLWRTQGLEALSNATVAVSRRLNRTIRDVKVFVTIPYPDPRQHSFGSDYSQCRGGPKRDLDFSAEADRVLAAQCFVASITESWPALPGVRVAGFYWFLEDLPPADVPVIKAVTEFVHQRQLHGQGMKITWIPYYNAAVHVAHNWQALGFDFATIQPNFAFNNCTVERFAEVEALMLDTYTGVEMELPLAVRNPSIGRNATKSFMDYYDAAVRYNWTGNGGRRHGTALKTFYYGNAFVEMARSTDATIQGLYSRLHDLVCGVGMACL